ncbi:MAG: 3,4-dihydroxy-2-butanone-4-phosphate synthase, partial [Planctomycetes bacterium]|nr:3,4-dihydroxy-2-butanone-4-phosphate synthase [Planctomycetota bacterium]
MPTSDDFVPIEEALAELRAGRMIVLLDDEQRENEGDFVIPAECATPEMVNFMMRNGCGLVCLAMSGPICERLHLDVVSTSNVEGPTTPFTQKFDARYGITTGTSAFDRARTIAVAIDDNTTPADLVRGKGHMDGLRAKDGGVLVRAGHTEGSVDLARLAGFKEAAVICEIVHPDGTMARLPFLREFCKQHNLKMCTIEDLIKHRRQRERLIHRELVVKLPTKFGEFDLIPYTSVVDTEPHLALCMGGVGIEVNGVIPVQAEP